MSENSLIEWTDATWNPLLGCSKCSAGCKLCYAIRTAWRLQHNPDPNIAAAYAGLVEKRLDGSLNWTGKINLIPDRLHEPISWKKPRKIFVNSQSDLFHEDVPFEFVDKVFAVMAACPQHTFQVLTKRAARMQEYMQRLDANPAEHLAAVAPEFVDEDSACAIANWINGWSRWKHAPPDDNPLNGTERRWPLPNVWLGVSVEDQKAADERIPHLVQTPAAVRFLSCEPLLGRVNLVSRSQQRGEHYKTITGTEWLGGGDDPSPIHWIIAGGESGPGARPMHPDWPCFLRDQCEMAGVAFHFKQWGMWFPAPWKIARVEGESDENYRLSSLAQCATHAVNESGKLIELDHAPFSPERSDTAPAGWQGVRLLGKKKAGRLLDGVEHNGFPGR